MCVSWVFLCLVEVEDLFCDVRTFEHRESLQGIQKGREIWDEVTEKEDPI